jgi:hypothetical protein
MSNKVIRVTKAQRFEDIKAILNGEAPQFGTTLDEAMAALNHEIELLEKKNSAKTGERKATPNQVENEGYKKLILDFLATLPEDSDGVTCTEIMKNVPALSAFQVQKTSSLVRQLKNAGQVTSQEVKGRSLFRLV